MTAGETFKIPSREEHNRTIRKLWVGCITGAALVFLVTGCTSLAMFLLGYDSKVIVNVSTVVFQIILLPYGLGYVAPALATSLLKMGLGVEMSRQGLNLGRETADMMIEIKGEIKPLVTDLQGIIADIKPMIEDFRKQDSGRVHKILERFEGEMNGGGKLDRLVTALERIAKKTDAKADDALGDLLEEAWGVPKEDSPEGT